MSDPIALSCDYVNGNTIMRAATQICDNDGYKVEHYLLVLRGKHTNPPHYQDGKWDLADLIAVVLEYPGASTGPAVALAVANAVEPPMEKLESMCQEELLEMLDMLCACSAIEPEAPMMQGRRQLAKGAVGDKLWEQIKKYQQPLINYIYRSKDEEIDQEA